MSVYTMYCPTLKLKKYVETYFEKDASNITDQFLPLSWL